MKTPIKTLLIVATACFVTAGCGSSNYDDGYDAGQAAGESADGVIDEIKLGYTSSRDADNSEYDRGFYDGAHDQDWDEAKEFWRKD